MVEKLVKHLENYCKFENLADNISDEKKMKGYLTAEFEKIFEPLFVSQSDFVNLLLNKDNLNYGAAHLWSYKFNKRIGQYIFPKEMANSLILKSIKTFFFDKQERAKFFDITNILSQRKQPIINKRGSSTEMKKDKNWESPEIILPEDVLFPSSLKPKNYNSEEELIQALKKAHKYVSENANKEELCEFFDYFVKKHKSLLNVDITTYQPKEEILKLFPSILLEREWKYLYRFICNLVPHIPAGGYFIQVKKPLSEEQVQNLQFICNFVYGKLALKELGLFPEDENFKELLTLFDEAFKNLKNVDKN